MSEVRRRIVQVQIPEDVITRGPIWTYPAAGTVEYIDVPQQAILELREADEYSKRHQLGQWASTAICGNDILSSVLYSSGLVAAKAGKLAPIPLLLVSVVLYFFRFIYEEVVTAIPLNGGSYNVLLNTTSKRVAAFGAALGILSYLATGVVSGTSAIHYLQREVHFPEIGATIGLLFIFAILNLIGIGESAIVAVGIFFHHILVLTILSISSFIYVVQDTSIFKANLHTTLPPVDFAGNIINSNVFAAIFFGFSAAMLGITGFESSAQFVEEQQPGVFRKTLRNMWILVTIFNAILSILSMGVLPMKIILANQDTVLAEMGAVAAGRWLEIWVAIDAFLVLSGAVLTSYVGITGLVRRLAFDRVLPTFLSHQNKFRKTCHWIIILYFLIASSLVLLLKGNTTILAGVYTYAFLGLMALFSFGCMVLKAKRAKIPRAIHAPWWSCIMGFLMVIMGMLGNLLGDPKVLMYFAFYLIAVLIVMIGMMERVQILKVLLAIMKKLFPSGGLEEPVRIPMVSIQHKNSDSETSEAHLSPEYQPTITPRIEFPSRTGARGGRTITKAIMDINDAPIVFFCKHVDMTIINKAILYVRKNEQTNNLRIVHVMEDFEETGHSTMLRQEFENVVALFDAIYPKLKIDFILVRGPFERATVQWLAQVMEIPINLMFIAQPGDQQVHQVAALGVRVITA